MRRDGKLEEMAQLDLFRGCRRSVLRAVGKLCTPAGFCDGTVLVDEGACAQQAFIVLSGLGRVTVVGREVGTIGCGSCVSILPVLTHRASEATVRAATAMGVLVLSVPEVRSVVELDRMLAERLRLADCPPAPPTTVDPADPAPLGHWPRNAEVLDPPGMSRQWGSTPWTVGGRR